MPGDIGNFFENLFWDLFWDLDSDEPARATTGIETEGPHDCARRTWVER